MVEQTSRLSVADDRQDASPTDNFPHPPVPFPKDGEGAAKPPLNAWRGGWG